MQTSTKIILAVTVVSILGLGGLAKTVYGKQSQPAVVVTPQNSAASQKPEASDGDGEADDATEAVEAKQQPQNPQSVAPSGKQTEEKETNERPNDQDGGAKEDAH